MAHPRLHPAIRWKLLSRNLSGRPPTCTPHRSLPLGVWPRRSGRC